VERGEGREEEEEEEQAGRQSGSDWRAAWQSPMGAAEGMGRLLGGEREGRKSR